MGNCLRTSRNGSRGEQLSGPRQEPVLQEQPQLIDLIQFLSSPTPRRQTREDIRRRKLIEQLPKQIYKAGGAGSKQEDEEEECVICFESFVDGDLIRCLPCKHVYHMCCLDMWLMSRSICPYCRGPVFGVEPEP